MIIRIQRGGILTEPIVITEADAVVVHTDGGEPIMAAQELDGAVHTIKAGDPEFNLHLESLGVLKHEIPEVQICKPVG